MRTCQVEGCAAPHRARGLCTTHYNQQHQPNRHRKTEVPCTWCGRSCAKEPGRAQRYANLFCSLACRDDWRAHEAGTDRCSIPEGHPAHPRWTGRLLPVVWVPPAPARPISRRWVAGYCDDCSAPFVAEDYSDRARWCSDRCAKRVARRRRRACEYSAQGDHTWTQVIGLFLLFDRRCAYCGQPVAGQPDPDHVVPLSRGGSDTAIGKIPRLVLDLSTKKFTGNTGCNSMSGQFDFTDSTLQFNQRIVTTKMACVGYNEKGFLETLLRTNSYKLQSGTLILMFDRTELSRWTRKVTPKPVVNKA